MPYTPPPMSAAISTPAIVRRSQTGRLLKNDIFTFFIRRASFHYVVPVLILVAADQLAVENAVDLFRAVGNVLRVRDEHDRRSPSRSARRRSA